MWGGGGGGAGCSPILATQVHVLLLVDTEL